MDASSSEGCNKLVFLCVDESEHALRALEWFYEHSYRDDQTVGLVHIHSLPPSNHGNKLADIEYDYNKKVNEVKHKASNLLQCYIKRCVEYGMKVKLFSEHKEDSIGRTICNLVKEHKPTHIVMGQRGLVL